MDKKIIFDFWNISTSPGALIAGLMFVKYCELNHIEFIVFSDISSKNTLLEQSEIVSLDADIIYSATKHSSIKELIISDKKIIFFSPTVITFIRLLPLKLMYKNVHIMSWIQGDLPSEMRLKKDKAYRIFAALFLEYFEMKFSDSLIYVSNKMAEYYNKKYSNATIPNAIIYCSTTLTRKMDIAKEKNSFCYVGGMSTWQRVDWVFDFMYMLFENADNIKLYIYTQNPKSAQELLKQHKLNKYLPNIHIEKVDDRHTLETYLSKIEFGFLFRECNHVNKVASPIKYSEYTQTDVFPLLTDCIGDYSKNFKRNGLLYTREQDPLDFLKQIRLYRKQDDILDMKTITSIKYNSHNFHQFIEQI